MWPRDELGTKCNPWLYSDLMELPDSKSIIAGVGGSEAVGRVADAFMSNVSRAIVNKEDEIRLCLVTLLCEGHLLIEDVPGVGKTMLASPSPARSTALSAGSSSPPTCFPPTSRVS